MKSDKGELKKHLVIVDVPGVIEDAWEGKGIGPWFLRHLERVNTLLHIVAPIVETGIAEQLVADYKVVRAELTKYGKGLPEKKEIVVVNKMELVDEGDRTEIEKEFKKETGKDLVWVSAGMGEVSGLVENLQ